MDYRNKLAVIGDRDSIILFKTLGFLTYFPESVEDIEKTIRKLAKQEIPIIYITEETAQKVPDLIDYYKFKPFPAIILIPDKNGSKGIGMQEIRKNVEKAVGIDILNN